MVKKTRRKPTIEDLCSPGTPMGDVLKQMQENPHDDPEFKMFEDSGDKTTEENLHGLPLQIESRVSAEVAGKIDKTELKRLLHAKTRETLIDFYRNFPTEMKAKDLKNPLRIQVLMTTEKIGEITRFKFYVPATAKYKQETVGIGRE